MGRQILLVDDDRDLREVLGLALARRGYEVRAAGDGLEALEAVAERRPDLILTDLDMPRMGGIRLAEELARRRIAPPIPLIVLSADAEVERSAARVGAAGYLRKPFGLAQLYDALDRTWETAAYLRDEVARHRGVVADQRRRLERQRALAEERARRGGKPGES
jgi:CheY-like chemotaxis protein